MFASWAHGNPLLPGDLSVLLDNKSDSAVNSYHVSVLFANEVDTPRNSDQSGTILVLFYNRNGKNRVSVPLSKDYSDHRSFKTQ